MKCIKSEILRHQGSGFTVELTPDIRSVTCYECAERPFSGNRYWKKSMYHGFGFAPCDWDISLTPAVERALPKEIEVKQSLPTLIQDTRYTKKPTSPTDTALRLTGCRIHLTVPDDYAAKVYREVYTDMGIPFRDTLLTKHSELLQQITSDVEHHMENRDSHTPQSFTISSKGIDFAHDECFHSFEHLGMQPLKSEGQMYGMALAIIQKLSESYPEILRSNTIEISALHATELKRINHNAISKSDHIYIQFNYIESQKQELKEW